MNEKLMKKFLFPLYSVLCMLIVPVEAYACPRHLCSRYLTSKEAIRTALSEQKRDEEFTTYDILNASLDESLDPIIIDDFSSRNDIPFNNTLIQSFKARKILKPLSFNANWLLMRIKGGGKIGEIRPPEESIAVLNETNDVLVANITTSGTVGEGNYTDTDSEKTGDLPPFGNKRFTDFAMRWKIPRMPTRMRIGLSSALENVGLDFESRVGTVIARLTRLQEQQEARERQSEESLLLEESKVLPITDMGLPQRKIWIVTTASLPWMTGTSVNPLLRAAYLARNREKSAVSILLPFLQIDDQLRLFPEGTSFSTQSEQEKYLRNWLKNAELEEEADFIDIYWYPGRYLDSMGCIFPMGDITRLIPDDQADICIMEEPEHINWYRATGTNWSKKFKHVVGIIHTNYVYYASQDQVHWGAGIKGPWVRGFNKLMARAYCDKVIKLSAALQKFAEDKETVCNVGDETAKILSSGGSLEGGAYMLGKMLWEKGYDRLWDLMAMSTGRLGTCFPINVYGNGNEKGEIEEKAKNLNLPVTFHPGKDHATLDQYRVFVNPSVSEVLCTTIAEALAMGKWVVCARHSSNEFFYQFPNCLPFTGEKEFSANVWRALTVDPQPLSLRHRTMLSWEAATERLIEASKVTVGESKARRRELDEIAWVFHQNLGEGKRGDTVRKILQAGIISEQNAFTESYMNY